MGQLDDAIHEVRDTASIGIHHHLPFWWDIGAVSAFSLAVYYYAIHSRLGPERVAPNVQEAVADAHQEDLDLAVAEHV